MGRKSKQLRVIYKVRRGVYKLILFIYRASFLVIFYKNLGIKEQKIIYISL